MTCSACSGTITETVSQLPGISEVTVSLLNNSATVIVARKDLVDSVTETIDDCGFEVDVVKIDPLIPALTSTNNATPAGPRKLSLRVDGMYSQCVSLLVVARRVTHICESDFVQLKS
jgi:copper chaperone CopZ